MIAAFQAAERGSIPRWRINIRIPIYWGIFFSSFFLHETPIFYSEVWQHEQKLDVETV